MVVAGLALATVALTFAEGPTAVWRHSGIGAGRAFVPDTNPNHLRQWINEKRRGLVWEAEGIESSIGILGQDGLAFVVNGKTDGNSLEDSATQIGAAILGAVLHDDPKTALVIGLGTGESAGWLCADAKYRARRRGGAGTGDRRDGAALPRAQFRRAE